MRVLVVKTSSLGDIIQSFPVLNYLSQEKGCQVDWVVEAPFASLVRAHPYIHEVIEVDTKRWRRSPFNSEVAAFRHRLQRVEYDWVFDLQGNIKSGCVTFLAKSRRKVGFGWKSVAEWPNLLVTRFKFNPPTGQNIRDDYLNLVRAFLGPGEAREGVRLRVTEEEQEKVQGLLNRGSGRRVMVCPGAAWPNKTLLKEQVRRVVEGLEGSLYLIWGSAEERALADEMAESLGERAIVVDRLSLPALQNLMDEMDLVLAMDSLPLHLCGTTSTPSFSFFGPSSMAKYRPPSEAHGGIQGSCPYGITFEKRCPRLRTCPEAPCMRNFDMEQVGKTLASISQDH